MILSQEKLNLYILRELHEKLPIGLDRMSNAMSNRNVKVDVVLIQRADTSFYPPTINQANLLAKSGLSVALIDGGIFSNKITFLDERVQLIRSKNETHNRGSLIFSNLVRKFIRTAKPAVCIAFDVPAASLLALLPYRGKKIFHFHEYLCDYDGGESLFHRMQNKFVVFASTFVDLIVFPDSHRASMYYREYRLLRYPEVVRNCPVKIDSLPPGILKVLLEKKGISAKWIVIFQGAISTNYYADHIVASMAFWPDGAVMVFIGSVTSVVRDQLEQTAKELGVFHRLIFLGKIPYAELFSYTVDADVAFTMIKPVIITFRHMAGASNKRYEAMACGVPQISNLGPGMVELIEDHGIGVCIDPEKPENIGMAITELLMNPERRQLMGKRARELYLNRFNYDLEFSPVLNKIQKWCREPNEGSENTGCRVRRLKSR